MWAVMKHMLRACQRMTQFYTYFRCASGFDNVWRRGRADRLSIWMHGKKRHRSTWGYHPTRCFKKLWMQFTTIMVGIWLANFTVEAFIYTTCIFRSTIHPAAQPHPPITNRTIFSDLNRIHQHGIYGARYTTVLKKVFTRCRHDRDNK